MWVLVQRHTGTTGYARGVKAEGLLRDPPVIDCSGWVALLLSTGMRAANEAADRCLFGEDDVAAVQTWSDRLVANLERRAGFVLAGEGIDIPTLPRFATIGTRQGGGAWARNHPRPRGITHVVQVVRDPRDDAPYVSEAHAMTSPHGISLTPLREWLDRSRGTLRSGGAWAADPFVIPSRRPTDPRSARRH